MNPYGFHRKTRSFLHQIFGNLSEHPVISIRIFDDGVNTRPADRRARWSEIPSAARDSRPDAARARAAPGSAWRTPASAPSRVICRIAAGRRPRNRLARRARPRKVSSTTKPIPATSPPRSSTRRAVAAPCRRSPAGRRQSIPLLPRASRPANLEAYRYRTPGRR